MKHLRINRARPAHCRTACAAVFAYILTCCFGTEQPSHVDFLPLPDDALPSGQGFIGSTLSRTIQAVSNVITPQIPESVVLRNEDGTVQYDDRTHTIRYSGGTKPVFLRTSCGQEIYARAAILDPKAKKAELQGPLVVYFGDTLTHAVSGQYDWGTETARVTAVRAKVQGTIVRGSAVEYKKDRMGKNYMRVQDAYVTTEDAETPTVWVGAGEIVIYPGDYGTVSGLSIAGPRKTMRVPILGRVPISHSLNPEEGYMPQPGTKSIWGGYLLNRYGVLFGNRRAERGMPTADYLATGLLDYRTRRGLAGGVELRDLRTSEKMRDMRGLSLYYAADRDPQINPIEGDRPDIKKDRYRFAVQTYRDLTAPHNLEKYPNSARWSLVADVNVLSDEYMLQDFFDEYARTNDRPDNNIRLVRKGQLSQTMLLGRFAPNDYYSTDERAEISYYRARSAIGNTALTYETRTTIGIMRQFLTDAQRMDYKYKINNLRTQDLREYYARLLNDDTYARFNTTHEIAASLKILRFLNITPKIGGGYSGYYGVDNVGADQRFMGYVGCDFDIKFYRYFPGVRLPFLGINGLYHVIHPYAGLSHGTISSANGLVPEIDTWSSRMGGSTVNPMPLDLMGFTGIDGWGKWTVWRLGMRNTLSTVYDGESRVLLNWNLFLDYNIDNPNTERRFSNLFSLLELNFNEQTGITVESQTPTVRGGEDFSQYNTSLRFTPFSWLETQVGHRYIRDHPIQEDANYTYIQANMRLNERYTVASRISWDLENHSVPIQQFSVSRKSGPWYVGATVMMRDNGGKKETGFGLSFTLGETGTSLPVKFF